LVETRLRASIAAAALFLCAAVPVSDLLAQQTPVVEGDILKINLSAGILTVRHGPIQNLGITTGTATNDFKVGDAIMLNAVQAGDHIKFTADRVNGQLTVTALKP
jgi:Cu/Ag efflux protein CusF